MERQLGILAAGLLERGYELTVVARRCGLEARPGLRWVRVPGPARPFSFLFPWFFVAGSLAVLRSRRGLVHTTGALVGNRADVSTVHFCHAAYHARTRAPRTGRGSRLALLNAGAAALLSRLAERWCYRPRRSRRLVAVSGGVAHELAAFFPDEPVTVIPNGVDREAFAPDEGARRAVRGEWKVADGELVALFVGGEWERKGLRHAIEGVARNPRWRLVVVGEGERERFGEIAAQAGAGERVHFAGVDADPARFYAAADAFLLPTAYETFSLVTFEAAAAGLPLLVSRVSGVEDILEEGRNGWFIDRDAERIAGRLRALEDEAVRREMGEAARADSAGFGWDVAIEGYDRLYRKLAER
jgi:glycosyltransferase involved in cell wall biosynthesis